jgi:hypothetical protein
MPLPGIGEGFFAVTRNTIVSGFLALPIVLITVAGFLATSTANVGFMLVFLAQIFVIPLLQFLLGFLRSFGSIQRIFQLDPTLTYAKVSKGCAISPVDVAPDMIPPPTSYWMANVLFFTTYILTNAYSLYSVATETKDPDPTKEENRKAQALTAFILTLGTAIVLISNYYMYVGCETPGSLALALLLYVPLGYGWYKLAEFCGLRTADTFGIASQLFIPTGSEGEFPYACINLGAKTNLWNFGSYGNLTAEAFIKKFLPDAADKTMTDVTSEMSPQGVLTITLILNKADKILTGQESIGLAAIADTFKSAFNTGGTTRTTETTSGANNRTVLITVRPVVAYTA